MSAIDKYNMISLAPSLVIIAAMIVIGIVGGRLLKKAIVRDAEKAAK